MAGDLIQLMISFYREELTDKRMYQKLAASTSDADYRENLIRLSNVENSHAEFWGNELKRRGVEVSGLKHKRLKLFLTLLASKFVGQYLSVRLLESGEYNTCRQYADFLEKKVGDEPFRQGLSIILKDEIEHEDVFENRIEKTEEQLEKNRSIILGISDGLVEILAAVAGLTAIIENGLYIALSGLVVAMGGTLSMMVGVYLAKAQESDYKISKVKKQSLFGLSKNDHDTIKAYKQEGTSSAYTTGLFYILGAAFPMIPYVFLPRYEALVIAIILVGLSQWITNAFIALSMSVRVARPATRAALLALGAAGATLAIGTLFHELLNISLV